MARFRWGIAGTGDMATRMAEVLHADDQAELTAVASRRPDRADEFAARYGIAASFGSYEGLTGADLDAVYIAATNDQHHRLALTFLGAGMAVLCEKPLALNDRQAAEMVAASEASGAPLVEAMWMRFQPHMAALDELLAAGTVGEVLHLQADAGFPLPRRPETRWYNPALGGGSLIDMGVYPLTLAFHVLGPPESSAATAVPSETGVDAQIGVVSRHAGGTLSVVSSSLIADASWEATISGSDGRIRVHAPFHHSPLLTVHRGREEVARYDTSSAGDGIRFQVPEVHRCMREGRSESPVMPHADSVAIVRWTTELRRQVGVSYPGE